MPTGAGITTDCNVALDGSEQTTVEISPLLYCSSTVASIHGATEKSAKATITLSVTGQLQQFHETPTTSPSSNG